MVNQDIVNDIQRMHNNNFSLENMYNHLILKGYDKKEIDEAYLFLQLKIPRQKKSYVRNIVISVSAIIIVCFLIGLFFILSNSSGDVVVDPNTNSNLNVDNNAATNNADNEIIEESNKTEIIEEPINETENIIPKEVKPDLCSNDLECEDDSFCTIDECKGTPKICQYSGILTCIDNDGCCPIYCDDDEDSDCIGIEYRNGSVSVGSNGGNINIANSISNETENNNDTMIDDNEIECDPYEFLIEIDEFNVCNIKKAFVNQDNEFCNQMEGSLSLVFQEACVAALELNLFEAPLYVEAMYYLDLALNANNQDICLNINTDLIEIQNLCLDLLE